MVKNNLIITCKVLKYVSGLVSMQTMVVHCIPGATLHAGNPVIVTSQVTNTMNADDLKQIHDLFNATFRP